MGDERMDLDALWAQVALGELPEDALDRWVPEQGGDPGREARLEAMRRQLRLLPRLPRGAPLPHSVVVPPPEATPSAPLPAALLARLKAIPDERGAEAAGQEAAERATEAAGSAGAARAMEAARPEGAARATLPSARGSARRPYDVGRTSATERGPVGGWRWLLSNTTRRSAVAGAMMAVLVLAVGVWQRMPRGADEGASPGLEVLKGVAVPSSEPTADLVLLTRESPGAPVRPLEAVTLPDGGSGLSARRNQVVLAVLHSSRGLSEAAVYAAVVARPVYGTGPLLKTDAVHQVLRAGNAPVRLQPVPDRTDYYTEPEALKVTVALEPGTYRLYVLLSPDPLTAGRIDAFFGNAGTGTSRPFPDVVVEPAGGPPELVHTSTLLVVR